MSDEVVYHHSPKIEESCETTTVEAVEQSDRGLFDFMKKKEEPEKCEETAISSEFEEKVNVSEPEPKSEEKHETLLQKFHQSHDGSSSSSSSDEECEDGEKKKKKKQKPLKQVNKEKIDDYKEKKEEEDTCVPVEKYEEVAVPPPSSEVDRPIPNPEPEEKNGLMEKIKEKLHGDHKKAEEEQVVPPPPTPIVAPYDAEGEPKEKKGIIEKIKEKIPGYHSKSEEEKEKEKVKECD